MTLLVLELKVPSFIHPSNHDVWHVIASQYTILLSYFISFTTLFVYWRAHNFVVTVLAKNIDVNVLTINGIFLFLVGLIPFTTQLAGSYSSSPIALSFYALNIILIGSTLLFMRGYIEKSEKIDNLERTLEQRQGAFIRTMLPLSFAAISIPLSFISTKLAFSMLIFGVLFNLYNNAADLTRKVVLRPMRNLFTRAIN